MEESTKNKSILVIIGENVNRYRQLEGMTLSEFACKAGCSKGRVHEIEHGQANLQLRTVATIADKLGVKVIDLVEDWDD